MKRLAAGFSLALFSALILTFNSAAKAETPAPMFNWSNMNTTPAWNVYVGGLYLQRSRPSSAMVIGSSPAGSTVMDAHSFDFGWDTIPEFVVQRRTDNGWTFEGRYFGNLSSNATSNIANITTFRIAGIGVTILGGGPINALYSTQLQNAEFNVYRQVTPGLSLLAGFRWIELQDKLRTNLATATTFVSWDNSNQMYGAQIGANLMLTSPGMPLVFNASAKVGLFNNSAENRMTSNVVGGARGSSSPTSVATELNLTGTYQINNNLAFRAGYMLLWLDKVALASEAAASTTQIAGGTSSPVNTGNVWFQGVSFGLNLTF